MILANLCRQVAKTRLAVSAAKAVMTRSTYGPAPKEERDLLCPSYAWTVDVTCSRSLHTTRRRRSNAMGSSHESRP